MNNRPPKMISTEEYYLDQSALNHPDSKDYISSNQQDSHEYLNQKYNPETPSDFLLLNQGMFEQHSHSHFQGQPDQLHPGSLHSQIPQYQLVSNNLHQHQQQQQQQQPYFTHQAHLQQQQQPQHTQPLLFFNQFNPSFTTLPPNQFDDNVITQTIPYNATKNLDDGNNSSASSAVFPPMDAFAPPPTKSIQSQQEMPMFSNMKFYSDSNLSNQHQYQQTPTSQFQPPLFHQQTFPGPVNSHNFTLSPVPVYNNGPDFSDSKPLSFPSNSDTLHGLNNGLDLSNNRSHLRFKVIRGVSSGGAATKPPKSSTAPNHHYVPVSLELLNAGLNELCFQNWNEDELKDKRRIIRIERHQSGPKIIASFSIVGSAEKNPDTMPPHRKGVDVVEVSCLECYRRVDEDAEEDEDATSNDGLNSEYSKPKLHYSYPAGQDQEQKERAFYITTVEVIKIVELLIGTEDQDASERRRERGRIRSNLVTFWSKKPISSRVANSDPSKLSPASSKSASPLASNDPDFRHELATRIMGYEIRKPRGFDKEVRILKWEKLIPSLQRALQSYYAEIPDNFKR